MSKTRDCFRVARMVRYGGGVRYSGEAGGSIGFDVWTGHGDRDDAVCAREYREFGREHEDGIHRDRPDGSR